MKKQNLKEFVAATPLFAIVTPPLPDRDIYTKIIEKARERVPGKHIYYYCILEESCMLNQYRSLIISFHPRAISTGLNLKHAQNLDP